MPTLKDLRVSIIITTHNRRAKLLNALRSVLSSNNPELIYEIIVVDDASTDDTLAVLQDTFSNNDKIRVIRCDKEQFVSGCRNIGSRQATGEFIFFLDDDVIISKQTIYALSNYLAENPKVACVLPLIMYYDKPQIIWSAGIKHNLWTTLGKLIGQNELDQGQFKEAIQTDSVMTAFVVRKSITEAVTFDSERFPIGWEDMDYTTRIKRLGYDVVVLPWVKVWHDYPGAHFLKSKLRLYCEVRNRIAFHKRWSQNPIQYFTSYFFSILVGLNYVILTLFFSKNCFVNNTKTVIRALTDEIFFPTKRITANTIVTD